MLVISGRADSKIVDGPRLTHGVDAFPVDEGPLSPSPARGELSETCCIVALIGATCGFRCGWRFP
jgi:hypothetical protein